MVSTAASIMYGYRRYLCARDRILKYVKQYQIMTVIFPYKEHLHVLVL
jgi:hypothetical protein